MAAAVAEELAAGRSLGVPLPDPANLDWVRIAEPSDVRLLAMVADLGAGERASLALALATPDALVILDDLLARRHADALGIRYTGTLGVLLRAKASGLIPAVGPVLTALATCGFRLSPDTRDAVLRRAGEPATGI